MLEEDGNFRGFRVFDFDSYTKIENSENSEIVSRLVKLIGFFCLFGETRKFRDFRVFDFDSYTKIENSENSKIVSRLVKLIDFFCLFGESRKFRDFRVFYFNPYAEIKNSENFSKYFQGLQKKVNLFCLRKLYMYEVIERLHLYFKSLFLATTTGSA